VPDAQPLPCLTLTSAVEAAAYSFRLWQTNADMLGAVLRRPSDIHTSNVNPREGWGRSGRGWVAGSTPAAASEKPFPSYPMLRYCVKYQLLPKKQRSQLK